MAKICTIVNRLREQTPVTDNKTLLITKKKPKQPIKFSLKKIYKSLFPN